MTKSAGKGNRRRPIAHTLGLSMLTVYLAWNAWWLAQATVPPALFKAITGLPAPTTGGTRSVVALVRGDWSASLYYNPLTIPILLLLVVTIYQVARRRVVAPWVGRAWPTLLLIAWIVKLTGSPDAW